MSLVSFQPAIVSEKAFLPAKCFVWFSNSFYDPLGIPKAIKCISPLFFLLQAEIRASPASRGQGMPEVILPSAHKERWWWNNLRLLNLQPFFFAQNWRVLLNCHVIQHLHGLCTKIFKFLSAFNTGASKTQSPRVLKV